MTHPAKIHLPVRAKMICAAAAVCASVLAAPSAVPEPGAGPAVSALGHVPLYFEASVGQNGNDFQFFARGRGCNFFVAPTEALLTLTRVDAAPDSKRDERADARRSGLVVTHQLRFEFVGANRDARVSGAGELAGRANYFLGRDSAQWRTGVPLFGQVRVPEIYPGVDLVYYGNERRLKYDFLVAPKAAPENISIHFTGADHIRISPEGELVFTLGRDEIRQPKPVIYQLVSGARTEIAGGYQLTDRQTVRFEIGAYDHALPLVIDPVLSYSTYFGKSGSDIAWDFATDKAGTNGFVYVAGETLSANLPVTTTNTYGGGSQFGGDVFVAKFNNTGTALSYLTYLGGKGDDAALGIAVDPDGNAYITGFTTSTNFPTPNGLYTNLGGGSVPGFGIFPQDAFVAKLNPSGALAFATYLGGSTNDVGVGIALDEARNIYVAGYTGSTNFPTTNAAQTALGGRRDAFVTKLNAAGNALIYSTYFGGTNAGSGEAIAVDAAGNAFVAAYDTATNGALFAVVQKFSPSGGAAQFYSVGGNSGNVIPFGIALDASGDVYLAGAERLTNFPTTIPLNSTNHSTDAFVIKLAGDSLNPIYRVAFGGSGTDEAWGVAVDAAGNAHVVGETYSTNFPTLGANGFLRATNSGGSDVFVTVINSNGTAFVRSALLGGSNNDFGYAIDTDPEGDDIIVGRTYSANFPTVAAYQSAFGGTNDGFIAKITVVPPTDVSLSIRKTDPDNVTLSWPINSFSAFAPDYALESNPSVVSPNGWIPVSAPDAPVAGQHQVTLGATNDALFFRLKR